MEYKYCGTACPPTCADPDGTSECEERCVEGCFCKEGFVADGDTCLRPDQCGCSSNGIFYMVSYSLFDKVVQF